MNLATVVVGLAILIAERIRAGDGAGRFRVAFRATSLAAMIAAFAVYPRSRQLADAPAERPTIWACVDVSRSMSTRDVVPDRLSRAKSILQSIVPALDGFPVGVIAFAGEARIVCPPTSDLAFVEKSIRDLSIGSVATGGSNLLAPFERIERGDLGSVIIIVSDGGHPSLPADRMADAKRRPIAITIGVGNPAVSTPMPEAAGDYSTTTTRLEEVPLRTLADRTGGVYIPARTRDFDGAGILSRVISMLAPRANPLWNQRLSWFLMLFGVVLALAEPVIDLAVHRRRSQLVGA